MEHLKSTSPLLHLDLDNFCSPEAEDSRYVLTSPRSIESCAKLGVKPVDLLFRPLTDFIDENQGSSLEEVTELFGKYEKGRRERLRLCREERERIMQGDWNRKSPVKPFMSQSNEFKTSATDGSVRSMKFPSSFSLADLRRSPVTERRLKNLTLEISRKLHITVPEKDQKIAGLMLAKYEEEQCRLHLSKVEEENREEEQRRGEVRKAHVEQMRRKQLLEHIRRWQEDLEERRRRRNEEDAMLVGRREKEAHRQEERWRRLAEEQQANRRFKHDAASKDAKERKYYQERLLRDKERAEEVQREKERQAAREKQQHAMMIKRMQEKKEMRRIQEENRRELLKHLLLKKEVEERERAEKELKRKQLEEKLQRCKENHALVFDARVLEMRSRAAKEEEQMRMAQQRAGRENTVWLEQKQMLLQRHQTRTERAVLQAREHLRRRAQRVKMENLEKEEHHRRLQDRVSKEEKAQWEEKCKAVMEKELRSEKLQKERLEALETSRKVAHASCYMRDRVREQTARFTFDQMAREAEMTAQMGQLK